MGLRHYKFQPNEYVLVMKNGKVVNQGIGLAFFCNTLSTGMSVVPTVSFDTFFAFDDVMTSDFQGINIQGDISYIIRDYEKVAGMIDFSYTSESEYENKKAEAKQVLGKRITNLAKTSASKFVNARDVKAVIHAQEELATFLTQEMTSNEAIKERADSKAYANEVVLKAMESVDKEILLAILLSGMDSKTLIAKAFNSLAENTDKIGNLNISPDLLETLTSVKACN